MEPLRCECMLNHCCDKLLGLLSDLRDHPTQKRYENCLMEIKAQLKAHQDFKFEYALNMVELVKSRAINVGPDQDALKVVKFDRNEEAEVLKRRKKKRKTVNKVAKM